MFYANWSWKYILSTSQQKLLKINQIWCNICAIAHEEFIKIKKLDWENIINKNGMVIDLKVKDPRELNAIRT